jgi:hypothetical protein
MISLEQNCTDISVRWVPSSTGDLPISFGVLIEGLGTRKLVSVGDGTSYLPFSGLESDSLYTITVSAINCAGSNKVNKTVYTC